MANEIVALEEQNGEIGALFLIPITTPKQVGGVNVVPTPSAGLPAIAAAVLTQGEKDALDAGTSLFVTRSFLRQGIAGAALLAKVQADYALAAAAENAAYNARYALAGNRYNAT